MRCEPDSRRYGFGGALRLHKTDEFSSVFHFRRSVAGTHFRVFACPNGKDHPRLGLVIGKRMAKRSVCRNRIRRLIREVFRHHQAQLVGVDVVVRLHRPLDITQTELACAEISDLLQRARQRALRVLPC